DGAGGARVGRRARGAAQGPAARPGLGDRAHARDAPADRAAQHAAPDGPEPEARVPERARPRPAGRDVGAAPVLPIRRGHAGPRPALGPEAVVRLKPDGRGADDAVPWPAWEDAAFYLQEPDVMYASIAAERHGAPVHWYEPPGFPTGLWVLSKWEDQRLV